MRPLRLLHLEDETFDADLLQRAAQRLSVETHWQRVGDAAGATAGGGSGGGMYRCISLKKRS